MIKNLQFMMDTAGYSFYFIIPMSNPKAYQFVAESVLIVGIESEAV